MRSVLFFRRVVTLAHSRQFLAWHNCLEFPFAKNRSYESVMGWVSHFNFLEALENFISLQKSYSTDFHNGGIHRKTAYILVCLHSRMVFYCCTFFCLRLSKKCVG